MSHGQNGERLGAAIEREGIPEEVQDGMSKVSHK